MLFVKDIQKIELKGKQGQWSKRLMNILIGFFFTYGVIRWGIDLTDLLGSFVEGKVTVFDNYAGGEKNIDISNNTSVYKEEINMDQENGKGRDDFPPSTVDEESGKGGDDFPPFPPSTPSFSFKGFFKKGEKFKVEQLHYHSGWWRKKEVPENFNKFRTKRIKIFIRQYIEEQEKLEEFKKKKEKIALSVFESLKRAVYGIIHNWSHVAMDLKRTIFIDRITIYNNRIVKDDLRRAILRDKIIKNNLEEQLHNLRNEVNNLKKQLPQDKDIVLENILEEAYQEWLENILEEAYKEFFEIKNKKK